MNELAAFDAEQAVSNMGGDWDLYWMIVDIFVEGWPTVEQMFVTGLEGGSAEALKQAAHRLKGSAGNLGATAIYQRCNELEQQWASGRLGDASQDVAALTSGVKALIDGLLTARSRRVSVA